MGSGDGLVIHSHNSHDRCRVWRWMKWEEGRSATAWEWNFTSSCWQETNSLWTRYHNKTVTRPNFGVFSKSWKTSKSDLTYLLYIYILYIYIIIHTHVLRTDFGAKEFFGCLKIQGMTWRILRYLRKNPPDGLTWHHKTTAELDMGQVLGCQWVHE